MALRLVAELGGDGSGFDAMMNRAHGRVRQFGSQAIAPLKNLIAGAFTVGAITSLSRKTIEYASHIRDISDALRVNVEWFQKRANAAKLAGGSEEDLFKFLDEMNKQRAAAVQDPGGEMAQRFGRLGFSQDEVSGLNTMAFFDKIVTAFGDGATAQTAVDVEKVGGRSARKLLAAFANQFQSDAPVMSEEMINQLDEIGDEFTLLGNQLMIDLAPAIVFVADAIRFAVNQIKQAGAFLGGFFANLNIKDLVRMLVDPSFFFSKKGRDAISAGQAATVSEAADQQDAADRLETAREKARAERKRREKSAPGFGPLPDDEPSSPVQPARRDGPPTDALVSVGNFLGRNPALVNSISEQLIQVARSQLDVLKQIAATLSASPSARGDQTMEFPG
jgi:hypothetical protein